MFYKMSDTEIPHTKIKQDNSSYYSDEMWGEEVAMLQSSENGKQDLCVFTSCKDLI